MHYYSVKVIFVKEQQGYHKVWERHFVAQPTKDDVLALADKEHSEGDAVTSATALRVLEFVRYGGVHKPEDKPTPKTIFLAGVEIATIVVTPIKVFNNLPDPAAIAPADPNDGWDGDAVPVPPPAAPRPALGGIGAACFRNI